MCADSNGFVAIPSCLTYGNGVDQVDDARVLDSEQGRADDADSDCTDVWDISAGTAAKCQCDDVLSNVPAPDLFCSSDGHHGHPGQMACAIQNDNGNGLLDNGETTRCTVYYNNQAASCLNPMPTPAENLQCATVGYVQFEIDYDESRGTVSNYMPGDGGSASVETSYLGGGDQVIRWDPESIIGNATSSGRSALQLHLRLHPRPLPQRHEYHRPHLHDEHVLELERAGHGRLRRPAATGHRDLQDDVSTTPVTVAHVASRRGSRDSMSSGPPPPRPPTSASTSSWRAMAGGAR